MPHKLPNYLRAYRKRAGFTEAEMALLLGCQSGSKVSRYEHFGRQPSLETAFAYEVVFRASARVLFGDSFDKVERRTLKQSRLLLRKLSKVEADARTARKLSLLRTLAAGVETGPHLHE